MALPKRRRDVAVRFNADECGLGESDLCPADFYRRELNAQVQTLIERYGELGGQLKALTQRVGELHEENQFLRTELVNIRDELRTLNANTAPVTAFWSDINAGKRMILGVLALVASVGAAVVAYREMMSVIRG